MTTTDNRNYRADEGKVLSRKSDGFIMGEGLCLGANDSIDNYEEIDKPEGYESEEEKMRKEIEERMKRDMEGRINHLKNKHHEQVNG